MAKETALIRKAATLASKFDEKLEHVDAAAEAPIECSYLGNTTESLSMGGEAAGFFHLLKLTSDKQFCLKNTIVLTDGPYKGCQAIIVKPDSQFPFFKLPPELRNYVYCYVVEHKYDTIHINTGTRRGRGTTAPSYRSKHRLAVLRTNLQIRKEVVPLLYSINRFGFHSTTVMVNFLAQIGDARIHLTMLGLKSMTNPSVKAAFHLLIEARNLRQLRISHVPDGLSPRLVAGEFYKTTRPWLQAVAAAKGEKGAPLKLLSFGFAAFRKYLLGQYVIYSTEEREQFMNAFTNLLETY